MVLLEREWVLEYPGTELRWGGIDLVTNPHRLPRDVYNLTAPEVGDVNIRTEDGDRPRQDGVHFGQDYRGGRTWTFTLGVKGTSAAHAAGLLAAVEKAWRGDSVRLLPGESAALTTRLNGVEYTMFGRPRRFTPNRAELHAWKASAVVTFDCIDDVLYGPEQTLRIDPIPPTSEGGVALPVAVPVALSSSSVGAVAVVVGGTLPAWFKAEIHGPISNPRVTATNQWWLEWLGVVTNGRTITLDARPWARTVLRDDGASFAGDLSRLGAMLSQAKVDPGSYQFLLSGVDPSGTSYVMLSWRNSYASMG